MLLSTRTLTWVAGHRLTDVTVQIVSLIQGRFHPIGSLLKSMFQFSHVLSQFFYPLFQGGTISFDYFISQGIDRLA